MAARSKLWYLERFHFLDVLTDAQKREVGAMARMSEVKRGQRIYAAGDPSDQVFLLKAGIVRISAANDDREERILALLYPGDIFGELAVVDEAPRDHLATAHEDVVLCAFGRDVLLRAIQQAPALGYRITKLMGLRLRRLETRIEELLFKSAHARIAHALLDMATDYGVTDNGGVIIPIRLNQRDLGNLVGLARETVNAVLQDFKQRGLVETTRRSIRIADPSRLRLVS
jgi:CRP-like cAMP-binding protein